MSIIKKWNITSLEYKEQLFDLNQVVSCAHWKLSATDGTNSHDVFGSVPMPGPQGDTFIPFENLTEQQVIDWVKEQLGEAQVATYEAEVESAVAEMQNPPVTAPSLPWVYE